MDPTRLERARSFVRMHEEEGCFILPNAWDIGSAKILEAAGFRALATTSAGIAFSLGRADHGYARADQRIERGTMIARVREMAQAMTVPLSADLEAGYGPSAEVVAETITLAIDAGACGGNIEDFTGDQRTPLFELTHAVERIQAAREASSRAGLPFVLVGRTDGLLAGTVSIDECVRRGNAYREAGADCIFVPGAADAKVIATLVREIDAPLNVVMGLSGNRLSVAELRDLGVRRVTVGGSLARVLYHQLRKAALEMMQCGTFTFADQQIAHGELNQIFIRGADERTE